jgi:hypothetical protein
MPFGYCHVVDRDCEAPAGYRAGNGVTACKPVPVARCRGCYELVCRACSVERTAKLGLTRRKRVVKWRL